LKCRFGKSLLKRHFIDTDPVSLKGAIEMIDKIKRVGENASAFGDAPVEIGNVCVTKLVHEYRPLYQAASGYTYGKVLDDYILDTFKDDPSALIQSFNIEISEEAAAALRDRCNRGEY
jgi:hypothetical protein